MSRSLPEQSTELRLATFRLARRLRNELTQDAVSRLTDAQFGALAVVNRFGPLTLSELAPRERVSAPSMNRTVNSLEEAGFVTRTGDGEDRRKRLLTVTRDGADEVEQTMARRDAWLTDRLRGLDDDERDVLARAAQLMERFATE
jgi:DNA-binding MarR family transcriptional regulator